jgi:hypothetical protein
MMDQTHIGYTYWQQPDKQKMPEVKYVSQSSATEQNAKEDTLVKTAQTFIRKNITGNTFYELNGYVSINTANYTDKKEAANIKWKVIPNIGKDGDASQPFL